jgi:hypothetical protein
MTRARRDRLGTPRWAASKEENDSSTANNVTAQDKQTPDSRGSEELPMAAEDFAWPSAMEMGRTQEMARPSWKPSAGELELERRDVARWSAASATSTRGVRAHRSSAAGNGQRELGCGAGRGLGIRFFLKLRFGFKKLRFFRH